MTPKRASLEFLAKFLGRLPKGTPYFVQWDESQSPPAVDVYAPTRKVFNDAIQMLGHAPYKRNDALPGEVNMLTLGQLDISILSPEASEQLD